MISCDSCHTLNQKNKMIHIETQGEWFCGDCYDEWVEDCYNVQGGSEQE